jgi:hypothetical protein
MPHSSKQSTNIDDSYCRLMKAIEKSPVDLRVIQSNLGALYNLLNDSTLDNLFDDFLRFELVSIIITFFDLISTSLEKISGKPFDPIYITDLIDSIEIGISNINLLMQYWSNGNKPLLSNAHRFVLPFYGSVTKVSYAYSIIANAFERQFRTHTRNQEKIESVLVPSYTPNTETRIPFDFLDSTDATRLLFVLSPPEDFFNIDICLQLLFHELAHLLPLRRQERNQILLITFFEEALIYISSLIIFPQKLNDLFSYSYDDGSKKEIGELVTQISRLIAGMIAKKIFLNNAIAINRMISSTRSMELRFYQRFLTESFIDPSSEQYNGFFEEIFINNQEMIVSCITEFLRDINNNCVINVDSSWENFLLFIGLEDQSTMRITDKSGFLSELICTISNQAESAGVLSSCRSHKIRFRNLLSNILYGAYPKKHNPIYTTAGNPTFSAVLTQYLENTKELICEAKADFIMIELLNLPVEKYKSLLKVKRSYRISELDNIRQNEDRIKILDLTNDLPITRKNDEGKKNPYGLFEQDESKRIAQYLNHSRQTLHTVFKANKIIILCANYCSKTEISLKDEMEFLQEITKMRKQNG